MRLWAHVHPSATFLNLDLIGPVLLVAAAALLRRRRDVLLLLAAAAALAVAALPPVHDAAHRSVTGHMGQHLILLVVAAPLIGIVAADAPGRFRGSGTVRRVAGAAVGQSFAPLVAGGVHASVVLAWHVPGAYDAAVDSALLHGLEHATMLGTGAWWWASVVHHARRRAVAAGIVSLFGVASAGAGLGVLMMFAPDALYAQGGVEDQQVAGALMAGGTGFVYGGTALLLVTSAIARLATPSPARIPPRAAVAVQESAMSRGSAVLGPVLATMAATAVALLVLPGSESADAQAPPPDDADVVDADAVDEAGDDDLEAIGQNLYRRDCASCHGPDGGGSFRGTALREVGTASVSYYLTTGRMPIADPDEPINRSEPAYSPEEIEAIIAYLDTLIDGPPPPDIGTATADVARGGEIYRLQCAACHGAEGIGGAMAIEGFAPSVLSARADEVANAMVAGPGVMPTFSTGYDTDDLASVAAYVEVLQDRPGTGLSVPGGRVGEGLVAWVVAMSILVAGARWIGGRG